ncbi:putative metalloprotease CJM1_0395 family protein [Dongshaea marina]|uniref:putative metalloprotease CJM1_0395 family protein n=1 Tax=Dongshaea marina TaxID=2047966 RepID=UPI001902B5D8|nr:putative metalloprotease CJM1_0395 family protein [Dongshaea marina]
MSLNVTLPNIAPASLQTSVEMARHDAERLELVSATRAVQAYAGGSGVGSFQQKNQSAQPPLAPTFQTIDPPVIDSPSVQEVVSEQGKLDPIPAYQQGASQNSGQPLPQQNNPEDQGEQQNAREQPAAATSSETTSASTAPAGPGELTPAEQQQVRELQKRDREVRAHELAHASIGGVHTGAAQLTYQTGPDGRRYAVGGEVSADVSPVPGDPDATIRKMQKIRNAALAPVDPSRADLMVASEASKIEREARAEISKDKLEKIRSELDKAELFGSDDTQELISAEQKQQRDEGFLPDHAFLSLQLRSEVINYRYLSSSVPAREHHLLTQI